MLIAEILFFGPFHFLPSFIFLEILLGVLYGRENPVFEGKERSRQLFFLIQQDRGCQIFWVGRNPLHCGPREPGP